VSDLLTPLTAQAVALVRPAGAKPLPTLADVESLFRRVRGRDPLPPESALRKAAIALAKAQLQVSGYERPNPYHQRARERGAKASRELLSAVSHWLDHDGAVWWEPPGMPPRRHLRAGPQHDADRRDLQRLKDALLLAQDAIERNLAPEAEPTGPHRRQTAMVIWLHKAFLAALIAVRPPILEPPSLRREGQAVRFIAGALELLGERPVGPSAIEKALQRHYRPADPWPHGVRQKTAP
jgi:hypothetical protein